MTSALHIRPYEDTDYRNVVALWDECGLLRPWNDPAKDIALCRKTVSSELWVGVLEKSEDSTTLVATIMTGSDGHRGWLYYLAVEPKLQRKGFARAMVHHAEDWLASQGIRKVELMIRDNNEPVRVFYERVGYETEPRIVMSRWLKDHDEQQTFATPRDQLHVVTTYLEMTQPPTRPPLTPPFEGISIKRAEPPTVSFYRYLYKSVGTPWLWYERQTMADDELRAIVQHPDVEVYVLYVEDAPAGYVELDRRIEGQIEVAYFGLMPEFMGRGLGPYLLDWGVTTAWHKQPDRVWVHTCNLDHPKARSVYERIGFVPYKEETTLIDDPRLGSYEWTHNR